MATIDEVQAANNQPIDPAMKSALTSAFWLFFHNNQNYKISVKKWFISVSVTIGQLEPLFVLLFGPDPLANNG